jgi:hypothetical protein
MVMLYWVLVAANAVGFATAVAGWWTVVPVCLLAAALAPRGARPLGSIPLGAALGWGVLLARSARAERFDTLTAAMATLIPLPLPALLAATVGLAATLALGATVLVSAFRRPTSPNDGLGGST